VNTANVRAGSTCAVFGLGAIGLATVMGCRDKKASRIVVIDINPDKFPLAKELGATDCVNPKDLDIPIDAYLQKEFDGGLDYTFECIGFIETMKQAFDSTAMGHGVCVLIGVSPLGKELPVLPAMLQFGKTLMGSIFGGYKSRDDVPNLVLKYMDGKLELDKFITHKMSLDQINEAFDLLKGGKCIRTVLEFK
jgi:Zn-dependent alcohol dehydrogenase